MTTIVKKRSGKGIKYYKYGYEKDPDTNQFKRKYLGIATEKDYLNHKIRVKGRSLYCKTCGKKKKQYADQESFCKCQQKQNVVNVEKNQKMR